jgi:DNA polymerase-3 subunit beta
MIFTLEKKEFSEAVNTVAKFAERRSATLPALSGIALVAGKDEVEFRATNLETGITLKVAADVKKEGAVALPAQTLRDIASSLGGTGSLTLEYSGDTVAITAGGAKSTIKTLPYDDFPTLPSPEGKISMTLPGATLRALITTVASCASPSTVRPELASVFLSAEGGVVKAVATDSFRLAEKKITLEKTITPFSILIPAKNALEVVQTIPDDDVTVRIDEHLCAFMFAKGTLTTRLVALQYPDYNQIIPKSFSAEAVTLRKDFEAALRRASVFSDSFQKIRLGFDTKGKKLSFEARNSDIGESVEETPAQVSGDSIELSFNHRYLQAPLPLISAESISVSSAGIGRPLVMRGSGDSTFLYLVMPMNQ